jgi:hypothetical protein
MLNFTTGSTKTRGSSRPYVENAVNSFPENDKYVLENATRQRAVLDLAIAIEIGSFLKHHRLVVASAGMEAQNALF